MKVSQEKRNEQNYKNFGLALIGILLIIFLVGLVGYIGYLDGKNNSSYAYDAGVIFGKSLRQFIDFFILSGIAYGSIFAFIASLEKKNIFPIAFLHGILGWGYIVYYALTRKTAHLD